MSDVAKETFAAGRYIAKDKAPYFRAALHGFAPIEVPGLGTIGVTKHGVLMIDWAFIEKVTPEECAGLLVHECLHIVLKHADRSERAGRDRHLDNQASDMAINSMVLDMGLKLPGGGPGVTVDHPLHGQYPEDHGWKRGLTADEYYELLRQKQASQGTKNKKHAFGAGGPSTEGMGGEGTASAPNNESGEGGQGKDADHDHEGMGAPKTGGGFCGSCAGNPFPDEPDQKHKASRSENELHRISRQVAADTIEHAKSSQGRGSIPAYLRRWAEEMLSPPEVPWQQELACSTRNACAWRDQAVEHRYDAPSRRQWGLGFGPGKPILPRLRMPVPRVAIIFDTSGSMGHEELSEAGREAAGILKSIGADVTFCTCDAAVTGISKVRSLREVLAKLSGGGGTDMAPAFASLMRERPRPEVIICATDLWIGDPGPEPQGTKVIWLAVGKMASSQGDPRWGKTIRTTAAKRPRSQEVQENDHDAATFHI